MSETLAICPLRLLGSILPILDASPTWLYLVCLLIKALHGFPGHAHHFTFPGGATPAWNNLSTASLPQQRGHLWPQQWSPCWRMSLAPLPETFHSPPHLSWALLRLPEVGQAFGLRRDNISQLLAYPQWSQPPPWLQNEMGGNGTSGAQGLDKCNSRPCCLGFTEGCGVEVLLLGAPAHERELLLRKEVALAPCWLRFGLFCHQSFWSDVRKEMKCFNVRVQWWRGK